jgi:hypothetical protein
VSLRNAVLYAAAGLAGWCAVAWAERTEMTRRTERTPSRSFPSLLSPVSLSFAAPLRPPVPGSAGLAGLPALIAAIPKNDLDAAEEAIRKWPPGTAREFALELLAGRQAAATDPFYDPDAPPEESAEPPYNCYAKLAESMAGGEIMPYGGYTTGGLWGDMGNLEEWISMDPAAATAAVLKMPRDGASRSAAVDMAVRTLAKSDPAAALEFYLMSGDPNTGSGTAEAWKKQVLAERDTNGGPNVQRAFLERLTLAQQSSLFASLADSIQSRDVSDPVPNAVMICSPVGCSKRGKSRRGWSPFLQN